MPTGYYGTILVAEAQAFYTAQCSVPFLVPRSLLANPLAILTDVSDTLFAGASAVYN